MIQRLHKLSGFLIGFLLSSALAWATTITWSHTFSDGEVLTASQLEGMKTNITDVVNAGGGPVGLTNTQTISGDKTLSGTTTLSGIVTATGVFSGASPIIFEGSTADAFELTLAVPDPTADVTYTIQGSASVSSTIKSWQNAGTSDVSIIWEGATADDFETTWTVTDPTADRTVTFGNEDINLPEQVVKAWCTVDNTGAALDSFNTSATVENSAGNYTCTWDLDFANDDYAVVGTCADAADSGLFVTQSVAVGSTNYTCDSTATGGAIDNPRQQAIAIGNR